MASSTPNTILLTVNGGGERPVFEEVVHTAAVTPGDFVTLSASGVTQNTSAADVDAQKMVAIESPYLDPRTTATAAIDTDYAVAAVARVIYAQPGDLVYGWLIDEGNVARGAALEIGADGLQALSTGRVVAFADEAVNNTGGSGPVRIKVRIA